MKNANTIVPLGKPYLLFIGEFRLTAGYRIYLCTFDCRSSIIPTIAEFDLFHEYFGKGWLAEFSRV